MISANTLLKHAAHARPALMAKTAQVLASLDQDIAKETAKEMQEIAEYTAEKLAFGPLATYGAALAGHLLTGVAGSMAGDLYDAAKRGVTKQRNLNRIMELNPQIKTLYKTDKHRVNQSFDALHRYAPELTADPLIGGTLLQSVVEVPGNEAAVIKDIIGVEKNLHDKKKLPFGGPTIELPTNYDLSREKREEQKLRMEKERHKADQESLGKPTAKDLLEQENRKMERQHKARVEGAKELLRSAIAPTRDAEGNQKKPSAKDIVRAWKGYRKLTK